MEVEFELLILLNVTILFTIAYILIRDFQKKLTLGSISLVCWIGLALSFTATNPTFPAFSMIFLAVVIILSVSMVIDVTSMLEHGKQEKKDWYKRD